MITVVLADDQGMIRSGLRSLLEREPDIQVVAEAADGDQALDAVRRHRPDVALIDIRMPNRDGISVTKQLMCDGHDTRVVMLTTFDLDQYVFDSLRAGASGFLLKDGPAEDLVRAVRSVAVGDALLSPDVTKRVIDAFAGTPVASDSHSERLADLGPRETEVLRLLARGHTNAEIASELVVSDSTAKTHVSSVLSKLEVRDRVQAVIVAYESGVVGRGG